MVNQEAFRNHLREALNHLHDPDRLERSPLAALFGVGGRLSAYGEIQDILTAAISAMRPGGQVPPSSRAWHIFELLHCRYVQEMSAPQVAHQLGLSVRHLHREQVAALNVLGKHLWRQFDLGRVDADVSSGALDPQQFPDTVLLENELLWLRDGSPQGPADLSELMKAAVQLGAPLAERHGVRVTYAMPDSIPGLAVHPVGLKQVLLSLITAAIQCAPRGQVELSVRQTGWDVAVELSCPGSRSVPHGASEAGPSALAGAAELARLCGMRLWTSPEGDPLAAQLVAPVYQGVVVLAVDDSKDALRLMERYVVGTRYRLIGERDPERALAMAESLRPGIVVLDVMMPQVDGWRVLGRLRSHPATSHVPIVVCTILDQEELALTLGAVACLRKPVTQQAFLAALDEQVAPPAPVSG